MEEQKQSLFEKSIKPTLHYIGTIGAVLMCLAYIVIVIVMVVGFNTSASLLSSLMFAIVNAVVGFIIMQFLKIQGIDFAKNIPNNKKILDEYNLKKPKKERTHSITYYWITSVLKDIITKCVTIGLTTIGIIYIVIVGSRDYSMLLLAVVNLVMFICFGLLALTKAYDFFNEKHIPFIIEKMEIQKENEKDEAENKKRMEMVAEKSSQSFNDNIYNNCGDHLLESSVDMRTIGANSESVVLDGSNDNNIILGGAIHPSSDVTNSVDLHA